MPEKMTTVTASLAAAARSVTATRAGWGDAGRASPYPLGGARREREQRVQNLRELCQRRVRDRRSARSRVQDPEDPAQQVADQVAGALDGVDAQLDLVRADHQSEDVEVHRPEVE